MPPNKAAPTFDAETWKILLLLSSVVFVAVVNGTMINVALPHIGEHFDATEGTYSWLVTGYSLTFGIFSAINGRLADLFGKRRMYMMGLAALGTCSLIISVAPDLWVAIAVRLLQGAGAAALPVLGTTIIKTLVAEEKRGRAIGVLLSTVGIAASVGPFLGGVLVQFLSWRAVFVVPGLVLLILPLAAKMLPKHLDKTTGESFDFVGALLLGVGMASVLISTKVLQETGFGPTLWAVLALAVVSNVAFFVWIQRKSEPFAPPELFATRSYVLAVGVGTIINATRFGSVILAPIFLTKIDNLDPIWVGAVLCPGAVAIALFSSKAGAFGDRYGPRLPVATGLGAVFVGGVITAFSVGNSIIGVTVGLTLFGLGFALSQSPLISAVTRVVPEGHESTGIGVFWTIFFVGGGAGVAFSVTITELRAGTEGLIGISGPGGGPYEDALLALASLALLGIPLLSGLPPKAQSEAGTSL